MNHFNPSSGAVNAPNNAGNAGVNNGRISDSSAPADGGKDRSCLVTATRGVTRGTTGVFSSMLCLFLLFVFAVQPARADKSSWTVEVSSTHSDPGIVYSGENLIDGDINTYWHSAPGSDPRPWAIIDFHESLTIYEIYYTCRQGEDASVGAAKRIVFSVSDDKENWEIALDADNLNCEEISSNTQTLILPAPKAGRYLKLEVVDVYHSDASAWSYIAEIDINTTGTEYKKEIYPLSFVPGTVSNISITDNGDFVTLSTTGNDPNVNTTKLLRPLFEGDKYVVAFEYKSNKTVTDAQFFYCVNGAGAEGGKSSDASIIIPQADDWTRFEFDLGAAVANFGFGMNSSGGGEPKDHFFRFDPTGNDDSYEISIRAMQVEVFYTGNPAIPHVPWSVEVSSAYDSPIFVGEHLIDGDINTCWHTNTTDATHWAIIDFKDKYVISKIYYTNRQVDPECSPKHIIFSVSDDKTNWEQAYENTEMTVQLPTQTITLPEPKAGRYLKLDILSNWCDGNESHLAEIDVEYTKWGEPVEEWSVEVSSVHEDNVGKNMIDGDIETCWHSATNDPQPWAIIDFKEILSISEIYYTCRQNEPDAAPKHIVFSVSYDKINWETALDIDDAGNGNNMQTLILPVPKSGRYLKIDIQSNWNPGLTWSYIGEIDFKYTKGTVLNAEAPTITKQPASQEITEEISVQLSVTAEVSDGGTLTYQWYSSPDGSNAGGTPVAVGATFDTPALTFGKHYFYVVVTNTLDDNGDGGVKTATTTSAVAMIHAIDPSIVNFPEGDGDGTEDNPYQITTVAELALLAELVNDGNTAYNAAHYKLMNDLDLNVAPYNEGAGWTPIGATTTNAFMGVFDGNGKTIAGLYINTTAGYQGLFGAVNGAEIKDLGITGASVKGSGYTGILAGRVQATEVYNCFSAGTVQGNGSDIGGLIGGVRAGCSVDKCYSTANVVNDAGYGEVHTGGLLGSMIGASGNHVTLTNSYATGAVSGTCTTGGLAGRADYVDISACHATGAVTGDDAVGGLVGIIYNLAVTTVKNCYATGAVTGLNRAGGNRIGGLIGDVRGAAGTVIENCYATGAVTGTNYVGGIVGTQFENPGALPGMDATLKNCIALNVSVKATGGNAGRVIGGSNNVVLSNNAAWEGILGNTAWGVPAHDNRQGESKTYAEIKEADFFKDLFGDDPAWTFAADKLPGLDGNPLDMPAFLTINLPDVSWYSDSETTFTISAAEELAGLAQLVNGGTQFVGKTVNLANDIDLSSYGQEGTDWNNGEGWIRIGVSETNSFRGTFDGKDKVITGLYINSGASNQGLFGFVYKGVIKNLGIEDAYVKGAGYTGILAGYALASVVENCYSSGQVNGTGAFVGGLIGYHDRIVAESLGCKISGSYSTAAVTNTSAYTGGLIGNFEGFREATNDAGYAIMENCYATGDVTGSDYVGGLIGVAPPKNKIRHSFATGNVTGDSWMVGGLVGRFDGTMENCYASGNVVGGSKPGDQTGGLVGAMHADEGLDLQVSITNCYATGSVSGSADATGGLVGGYKFTPNISISNSAALNPSVTAAAGRVMNDVSGKTTLSDNVAWAGMKNNAGTTNWGECTAAGRDGANRVTFEIRAADFFQSVFTGDVTGWTFASDKLPGLLGEAVALPAHLAIVDAQAPIITEQPTSTKVSIGESETLSVKAEVNDGGTLTYQWYSNTSESNTDGTLLNGETGSTYDTPNTLTNDRDYYYYVVVTNTIADNGDGGVKTATTTSAVATIEIVNEIVYGVTVSGVSIGNYYPGETVTISAGTTPTGMVFINWTSDSDLEDFDASKANTSFTMPVGAVEVTANFGYIVIFDVLNGVGAIGSTISATYDGSPIEKAETGVAVIPGKELVVKVVGGGASTYTYAWKVNGVSTGTEGDTYTATVNAAVNVVCTVTGNKETGAEIMQANPLKAWVNNGVLHVSGLAEGKVWNLYGISGALVKQGVAGSDEVTITLNLPGVYIIQSEGNTLKVAFN